MGGQACMCTCVYDLQIMPPLPLIQGDVCGGVVMGGCDGSGDGVVMGGCDGSGDGVVMGGCDGSGDGRV